MAEALRRGALSLLVLLALIQVACFTTSPRMHGLASELQEDVPELELDHQFGMTLGRMSLGMVKGIAKWGMDDDDRDAFRALRGVKKVELATYDTYGGDLRFPRRFEDSLDRRGWETLARFRDGGELGWIVYRMDGRQRLKNMLVVVHDGHSLTLVRLGGRLDRVVSAALAFSREEVLDEEWNDVEEWDEEGEWTESDDWGEEAVDSLVGEVAEALGLE
ncbi:MAG: DUF4252 domain-containing protein [Acidobacteriota bacterium]